MLTFVYICNPWRQQEHVGILLHYFVSHRRKEVFTSSANQLGCTDVPGLLVTYPKDTSTKCISRLISLNKLADMGNEGAH